MTGIAALPQTTATGSAECLVEHQHVVERELGKFAHGDAGFADHRAQRHGVLADGFAARRQRLRVGHRPRRRQLLDA